jgi:hypothetical protein
MTQTAELTGAPGSGATLSAAKSTIAMGTRALPDQKQRPYGVIDIFDEPESGWVNSSSPTYTAAVPPSADSVAGNELTLTQNAKVLTGGLGASDYNQGDYDQAYIWHASDDFSVPIILSAKGLTANIYGPTVTVDYAFAWDGGGDVFVFDGK